MQDFNLDVWSIFSTFTEVKDVNIFTTTEYKPNL